MIFSPKHILVPIAIDPDDDLMLAEHAVYTACDIAEKFSSRITLLHLAPLPSPGASAGVDVSGNIYRSFMDVLKKRIDRGRMLLQELRSAVESRHIAVDGQIVDSLEDLATVILNTAKEIDADLLVIGSHGRHGLSKLFFGSVAEKIAGKAHVPLLLLHPFGQSVKERR